MDKKPDRSEIITMSLLYALTLVLTVLKVTRTFSLPWLWVLGSLWLRYDCDDKNTGNIFIGDLKCLKYYWWMMSLS